MSPRTPLRRVPYRGTSALVLFGYVHYVDSRPACSEPRTGATDGHSLHRLSILLSHPRRGKLGLHPRNISSHPIRWPYACSGPHQAREALVGDPDPLSCATRRHARRQKIKRVFQQHFCSVLKASQNCGRCMFCVQGFFACFVAEKVPLLTFGEV